ncbi:MAG: nucleotide exchange factor GrpE [Trueperaceae bacterium]
MTRRDPDDRSEERRDAHPNGGTPSDGTRDAEARAERQAHGVEPDAEPTLGSDATGGSEPGDGPQTELEILRGELAALQERLADAEAAVGEQEERALRARAELDTVRRRAAGDRQRAHDAGVDDALAPAMSVHDDLRRALIAAERGDPSEIVPGVRAVLEGLERSLERLEVRSVGEVGERFDPDLHEALTTTPVQGDAQPGTIADVFEAGFARGERLIRPARVVVHQEDDA